MRRRRRRTGLRYRLHRFFRDRLPAPRFRRYRVVNRRRFMIAQAALGAVVVVALALSATVIARSVRTAKLNRELAAMYAVSGGAMEAEIAAPPVEGDEVSVRAGRAAASPYGELSAMVMPDGSPIATPAPASPTPERADAVATAVFHQTDLDILPEMLELTRRNPDTVGWLSIPGTVHLPVVYRDNTFYLDHDFTGAKNASGTLFLDEQSPVGASTQNLLVHGHSMNDGSMFGILTHYRRLDYLKAHPLISFSTLWEKESYAVFAVLQVSSRAADENYFNYFSSPAFASDAAFREYAARLAARSRFSIPVDVEPTDALLTLSTCIDDDRLVVVARKLRPGETQDEIVSAVEAAI